jgi:hypothetical protein
MEPASSSGLIPAAAKPISLRFCHDNGCEPGGFLLSIRGFYEPVEWSLMDGQ